MKIIEDLLSTLNYDVPLEDMRQGAFQTAVMTRRYGLASTPHDASLHHDKAPVKEAGRLLGKDAATLARMALSSSALEAAIGMVAINSLIEVDERQCLELNAGELLFKKGENRKVAIIGHFPFVSRLGTAASELYVIEKNPQEGDYGEDAAERLLPQADVVVIAGGMGPRAVDLLQERGITVALGAMESDPEKAVLAYLSGSLATTGEICGHDHQDGCSH